MKNEENYIYSGLSFILFELFEINKTGLHCHFCIFLETDEKYTVNMVIHYKIARDSNFLTLHSNAESAKESDDTCVLLSITRSNGIHASFFVSPIKLQFDIIGKWNRGTKYENYS